MRMDGLTAHANRRQRQSYPRRNTGTVDAKIYRWHSNESGLTGNAKQSRSFGG